MYGLEVKWATHAMMARMSDIRKMVRDGAFKVGMVSPLNRLGPIT
jgi:hypothetical protein